MAGFETFIKGIPAFSTLSDADATKLAAQCQPQKFQAGSKIIKRGDPGNAMFLIKSGEVKIPVLDDQGREKFVARLGPGEFFGEMALLTGEPRGADVIAESNVDALAILRQPLQDVLHQHPKVASFLT